MAGGLRCGQDVEVALKQACDRFVEDTVRSMIGPLSSFMAKATAYVATIDASAAATGGWTLEQQPFAKPEQVKRVVNEIYLLLKAQTERVHAALALYLGQRETEAILFRPIRKRVLDEYEQLLKLIMDPRHYTDEGRLVMACPSLEQIRLLLEGNPPPEPAPAPAMQRTDP